MNRTLNFRTRILLAAGLIGLIVVAVVVNAVWRTLVLERRLTEIEKSNIVSEALLRAGVQLSQERGLTNGALRRLRIAQKDETSLILSRRERADREIEAASTGLRESGLLSRPELAAAFESFRNDLIELAQVRSAATRAIYEPIGLRSPELLQRWNEVGIRASEKILSLRRALSLSLLNDTALADAERLKVALATIIDLLGRERSLVFGVLQSRAVLQEVDRDQMARWRQGVDTALVDVRILSDRGVLASEVQAGTRVAAAQLGNVFEDTRQRVLSDLGIEGIDPVSASDWWSESTAAIGLFESAFDRVSAQTSQLVLDQRAAGMRAIARQVLLISGVAILALAVLVGLLAAMSTRINALSRGIRGVAAGDETVPIPTYAERDEFASVADALRKLQLSVAEKARADAMRSEFLLQMNHDLRSPLNAIVGFADFMKDPANIKAEYIGLIGEAARTQLALVDRILDFSRLRDSEYRLVEEIVDPVDIAAAVCRQNSAMAGSKSIKLSVDGTAPHLRGARVALFHVLDNLVSNAVKYAPHDSAVHVALGREDDFVTLSVIDEGPGVPADERAQLFEPFYRGRREVGRSPGLGLGLSSAAALVRLHGGDVVLRETPGGGATFVVRLPAARIEPRQAD